MKEEEYLVYVDTTRKKQKEQNQEETNHRRFMDENMRRDSYQRRIKQA